MGHITTICKFVHKYMFQSATPAANGSNQSGSVITWAAVATPPPASPSSAATSFNQPAAHMLPSSYPVSSLTPQFSLNKTSEASKRSTSAAPNPLSSNDHSDFINSFLSTSQDFTSSTTPVSSTKTSAEQDKLNNRTEYESFHADFSSFLSEALTEPSEPLSAPSEDGNTINGTKYISHGEKTHLDGDHSTVINKDYATSSIIAINQQPQEHTPDSFDTLDNEVSSAQDILSVSLLFLVYKV